MESFLTNLPWLFDGVGVVVLSAAAALAARWYRSRKRAKIVGEKGYRAIFSDALIDIRTLRGDDAIYSKSGNIIVTSERLSEIVDDISVAGTQEVITTDNLFLSRSQKSMGNKVIQTFSLKNQLNQGDVYNYRVIRRLSDTFLEATEYWEAEIVVPTDTHRTTIMFPANRPPYRFLGKIGANSVYQDCQSQPVLTIEKGRSTLSWSYPTPPLGSLLRLEWEW